MEFKACYIYSLTVSKISWTYSIPYFEIFILSERRDTAVTVAAWEINNMAAH